MATTKAACGECDGGDGLFVCWRRVGRTVVDDQTVDLDLRFKVVKKSPKLLKNNLTTLYF